MMSLNMADFLGDARPGRRRRLSAAPGSRPCTACPSSPAWQHLERFRLQPFDVLGRRLRRRQQHAYRSRTRNPCSRPPPWSARWANPASGFAGDRQAAQRAGLDVRQRRRQRAGAQLHGAAEQRLIASPPPLNTTSASFGRFSRSFQELELDLRRRADRRRRAVVFFRIGPRERDEFLHRLRRQIGLHHEGIGRGRQFADARRSPCTDRRAVW